MDSSATGQEVMTLTQMASFATPELTMAWNDRKLELKLARLQLYNDILYNRLAAEILASREEIDRRLHECIRTATKPSELRIPIFTFKNCHGLNPPGDLRIWTEGLCKKEGWHWTMQANDDRYPVSHYSIITRTDICQRLALLFDATHFWVSCRHTGAGVTPLGACSVLEHELVLHYYPNGMPRARLDSLLACNQRQLARDGVEPIMPVVHRLVWVEGPGDEQPPALAYPRGPGGLVYRDGPHTPPREAGLPPRPPPELLRHGRGTVRDYDSVEDAARDLGRELMEEAAHDLAESDDGERPQCHCHECHW